MIIFQTSIECVFWSFEMEKKNVLVRCVWVFAGCVCV